MHHYNSQEDRGKRAPNVRLQNTKRVQTRWLRRASEALQKTTWNTPFAPLCAMGAERESLHPAGYFRQSWVEKWAEWDARSKNGSGRRGERRAIADLARAPAVMIGDASRGWEPEGSLLHNAAQIYSAHVYSVSSLSSDLLKAPARPPACLNASAPLAQSL